jgi:hypothetical protein
MRRVQEALARGVLAITAVAAGLIAVGILFVVLGGNPHNGIVSASTDAAEFLAGPFDELFTPHNRKLGVGVSWGVAALVYLVVGRVLATLIRR